MTRVVEAQHTLDCVGLYCPMPIVNVSKRIKEIPMGDVLEVLADDQGLVDDLPAWCKMTGHECLGVEDIDGELHGYVRRTAK